MLEGRVDEWLDALEDALNSIRIALDQSDWGTVSIRRTDMLKVRECFELLKTYISRSNPQICEIVEESFKKLRSRWGRLENFPIMIPAGHEGYRNEAIENLIISFVPFITEARKLHEARERSTSSSDEERQQTLSKTLAALSRSEREPAINQTQGDVVHVGVVSVAGDLVQSGASKVEIRDSVVQRTQIGATKFNSCPHCEQPLNLPKTPVFCPFCGEKLA